MTSKTIDKKGFKDNDPLCFSVSKVNRSRNPRKDFYGFATSELVKSNKYLSRLSEFDIFSALDDINSKKFHKIANECASNKDNKPGSYESIIGNFYSSAMDLKQIERLGFTPIEGMLKRIEDTKSIKSVHGLIAYLHIYDVPVFFDSSVDIDYKNTQAYALHFGQNDYTLPSQDHYIENIFRDTRKDYLYHITRTFIMKGIPRDRARSWANSILDIESELAEASMNEEELIEDENLYNSFSIEELDKRYTNIGLGSYIKQMGFPHMEYVIVEQPKYFDVIDKQIADIGIEGLKPYMYWNVIMHYSKYLHKAARTENSNFFDKKLMGYLEQTERWRQTLEDIQYYIGDAMGSMYVKEYSDKKAIFMAERIAKDVKEAFRRRIMRLDWMSVETRRRSLRKLRKMKIKIGYPLNFRDYSGLVIRDDDYVGNIMRCTEFNNRLKISRIDKSVDRNDWNIVPQDVYPEYMPGHNVVELPVGILQPPFIYPKIDIAMSYGTLGWILGHEMIHGFDDQGRKHDEYGNLNRWWTPEEEERFMELANEVTEHYKLQEVFPEHFINAKLTLGENIADLGGINIAYDALQMRLLKDPSKRETIDGFTPEQRFFIAYAQIFAGFERKRSIDIDLRTDTHSPLQYRGIIPAINHPKFDDAFKPNRYGRMLRRERKGLGVW